MQAVIEFQHVTKRFPIYHALTGGVRNFIFHLPSAIKTLKAQGFTALENINFNIYPGESVGIIGRNGSGKSTTLGLMAGVMQPTSGKVIVRERVSPMLELGGGFHPDLSGIENIMLNGVLLGLTRKQVKQRMRAILDFAELGEFEDQPIRTYSSGMLARLGFSVITQLEPKLLIIDEVLAVGDSRFREKCYTVIEEFKKKGVTILLVSHSASDIQRLCSRAIWIDNHHIRMDGAVNDVIKQYEQES